jgi:hypothetical protein
MLSSITRWVSGDVDVMETTVIALVGGDRDGVAVFSLSGWPGGLGGLPEVGAWLPLLVLIAAAFLDLVGLTPPGPRRQVDEDWLGRYRDWVTGLGYGAQLGVGFATIVPSWGIWALLVTAACIGVPGAILFGAGFGVGRSLLLFSTRRVDSTSALAGLMLRFSGAESSARRVALAGYGVVILIVGVYVA